MRLRCVDGLFFVLAAAQDDVALRRRTLSYLSVDVAEAALGRQAAPSITVRLRRVVRPRSEVDERHGDSLSPGHLDGPRTRR